MDRAIDLNSDRISERTPISTELNAIERSSATSSDGVSSPFSKLILTPSVLIAMSRTILTDSVKPGIPVGTVQPFFKIPSVISSSTPSGSKRS